MLKVPEALTPQEVSKLTMLRDLGSLAANGLACVDVSIPRGAVKACRPDNKVICQGCTQARSFTLMTNSNLCALCVSGTPDVPEPVEDKSYFCECGTCLAHYAVVRPELLNVRPKCHHCREQESITRSERVATPSVTCSSCQNKYLWQTADKSDDFICPPCEVEGAHCETFSVTCSALLQENATGNMSTDDLRHIFGGSGIFKMKDNVTVDVTSLPQSLLTYKRKPIVNPVDVKQSLTTLIKGGNIETATCDLCFSDVLPKHLRMVCGRKGCSSKACDDCLSAWYGATAPGLVALVPNLLCPFCKKSPAPKVISKHNKQLSLLRDLNISELDPSWYHGWCEGCYTIKPAVEKVCSEDVPELSRFKCEQCIAEKGKIATKDCPQCGVTTLRTSGCAHLTCPTCSTHWCWICGQASTYQDIYRHIATEHGGGYGYADEDLAEEYYDDGYSSDEGNF